MNLVLDVLPVVTRAEEAFQGAGDVKHMLQNRKEELARLLSLEVASDILEPEFTRLKQVLVTIEALLRKHTTVAGVDGKLVTFLKAINRGARHASIRGEIYECDKVVQRQLQLITTVAGLGTPGYGGVRSRPPHVMTNYNQQGMVARDRLVSLWRERLDAPPVRSAPVGMVGMGGMGKTTVAKAVCHAYGDIQWLTHVASFSLRPASTDAEISSLQGQALAQLDPTLSVQGWSMEQMQQRLGELITGGCSVNDTRSILLVLDNLHSTDDADNFIGEGSLRNVGDHCRVLITGRDREILKRVCSCENIYNIDGLDRQEAEQLLLQSASLCEGMPDQERQLVEEAMNHLSFGNQDSDGHHYHPLSTKVVGGALRGRPLQEKQRRLAAFIRDPQGADADKERKVHLSLRKSVEMLDDEHRRLFLDVALCLPLSVRRRDDVAEWGSWVSPRGFADTAVDDQLEALDQACLIKFNLVPPSRCGHYPCLKSGRDFMGVVAIHDLLQSLAQELAQEPDLQERRILYSIGCNNGEDFPPEWLQSCANDAQSIRMILVKSGASSLRDIAHFASNTNVCVAHVAQCTKLQELPRVASTVLKSVDLSGNTLVQTLPLSWCGGWLRFMSLRGCTNLEQLPFDNADLRSLMVLDLLGCHSLRILPALNMANLRMLNLSFCEGLAKLPELGALTSLEELYMRCCTSVKALGESIGTLTNLRVLNLNSCTQMRKLPDSLRNCVNLVFLELGMCRLDHGSLLTVFSISGLRFLHMERYRFDSHELAGIQGLTSIERLIMPWTNMTSLPKEMEQLQRLEVLNVWRSYKLHIREEVCHIISRLPALRYIVDDAVPEILHRDLYLYCPELRSKIKPRQETIPMKYDAAVNGNAGEASYAVSIVNALRMCGRDGASREQIHTAVYNLQAWVDSAPNRQVVLDHQGVDVLTAACMSEVAGETARFNAAVALHNVSRSFPEEVFNKLDLAVWFLVNHPPNSRRVHYHKMCLKVLHASCKWGRHRNVGLKERLVQWIADSRTEEMCAECMDSVLKPTF